MLKGFDLTMVSSYLVTTVSELGILRFRPCHIGGRSALLRSNRCVDVDWNKGQMAGPTTQKLQSFHNVVKRYRACSSANCTSLANKTGRERLLQVQHWLCACVWTKFSRCLDYCTDNLKHWAQLNMHTYSSQLLLEIPVIQGPTWKAVLHSYRGAGYI